MYLQAHQLRIDMTAVLLTSPETVSWLWHDADIDAINIVWSPDDELDVRILTEINPEESRQVLIDIGITSSLVELLFPKVWDVKFHIIGTYSPSGVVLNWRIYRSSDLIDSLRANGMSPTGILIHHRIECSSGTIIEIVCEDVLVNSVEAR
jgi:hypothetical protein